MPPKGTRKRAASTGQPQSKANKGSKPEPPTRVSRRLRSTSPSNQSPLRALSPPKRGRRRKPKTIPEDAEAEQRAEEAQAVDEKVTSETDNETVTQSQETNDDDVMKGETNDGDHNIEEEPAAQTEAVQPSVERSEIDETESRNDDESDEETQSIAQNRVSQSAERSDVEERSEDDRMSDRLPDSDGQNEVPIDNPEAEQVESEDDETQLERTSVPQPDVQGLEDVAEAESSSSTAQATKNQLYTSKILSPFQGRHQVSSMSTISCSQSSASNFVSSSEPQQDVVHVSESAASHARPDGRSWESDNFIVNENVEMGNVVVELKRTSKESHLQCAHLTYQETINKEQFDGAIERADIYKVQHEASKKVIESHRIQLQNAQGDVPGDSDSTPVGKRTTVANDDQNDSSARPSALRSKLRAPTTLPSSSRKAASGTRSGTKLKQSRGDEPDPANASSPTSGGDYLMSGALSSPSEDAQNQEVAQTAEAPKTPARSGWGGFFNPVASVKRIFAFNAGPRTEPVRRTAAPPENDNNEQDTVGKEGSSATTAIKTLALPPLRDAFGIPRDYKSTVFRRSSAAIARPTQGDYQHTLRVPGSFISAEDEPSTPSQPSVPGIPRHSFMPRTAPHPRRVQSGLQRRLQKQKEFTESEARKVAEARAQKARQDEEEAQRVRRETLKARSMNVPPEVIRASFIEKYGASAREIQEQQDKGVRAGMKRKARSVSPEAIPNPPGSSYGINDEYFDEDEVQNDQDMTDKNQSEQAQGDADASAAEDSPFASSTDGPSLFSKLFGSLSRSAKKPRLSAKLPDTFKHSGLQERLGHSAYEEADDYDDESQPSSGRRTKPLARSSPAPQLRFRKDSLTGQLEPVKTDSARGKEPEKDSEVSPWYSGPFTPAKRSLASPCDEMFQSPSVKKMKLRHEFKADFISESVQASGNAFRSQAHDDAINYEDVDEASAQRSLEQNPSADVADAIAYGQKYGCWTGPKGTGQFTVPESDSEDEDEEDEEHDSFTLTPSAEASDQLSNATPESKSLTARTNTSLSSNVFSKSQAVATNDPQGAQSQKTFAQETISSSAAETTGVPSTPASKSTDALARARSQAEKYKPKTPSTLRAISAMPSPLNSQDDGPGLAADDDESGEDIGPVTPRFSPIGAATSPPTQPDRDLPSQTEIAHVKELAKSKSRGDVLPTQQSEWPAAEAAPWAAQLDSSLRSAAESESDRLAWDAYADDAWSSAISTWKEYSSAASH